MPACVCCGENASFSILLAGSDDPDGMRWYIPNQSVRDTPPGIHNPIQEVWFCWACMRKVEDNLRATIGYLQKEAKARFS